MYDHRRGSRRLWVHLLSAQPGWQQHLHDYLQRKAARNTFWAREFARRRVPQGVAAREAA